MDKLDNYFEKCIKDAHNSEEKEYDVERVTWFYIVVNNQILFDIITPYARVTRRAKYRIINNVKKNFGFDVDGDLFLDKGLQPGFAHNKIKVGKCEYYLCRVMPVNEGRICKLIITHHGITEHEYFNNIDKYNLPDYAHTCWESFRELYFKAFDAYPEVEISHKSKTVESV